MRVLEPTLMRGGLLAPNNGGDTLELDFDFGNLEGAFLLAVDWYLELIGATGGVMAGVALNPNKAVPVSPGAFWTDENVIGMVHQDEVLETQGAMALAGFHYDLSPLGIYIARNVAIQGFGSGAGARACDAKIYYKRVIFTEAEIGGVIAFRR